MSTTQQPRSEGTVPLERVIALTDAVVAIAMTLLVLPLVEVTGEVETERLGDVVRRHTDLLLPFVVSFLVIYVFWAAHASVLSPVAQAGIDVPPLRLLTMLWLLMVAFLPFPTALVGRDDTGDSTPLYIGTMAVLSLLTTLTAVLADRATGRPGSFWPWLTTAVFASATLLATVAPDPALYSLLVLVVVRIAEVRLRGRGTGRAGQRSGTA
jgi:TMEM175 potassium channel family protein